MERKGESADSVGSAGERGETRAVSTDWCSVGSVAGVRTGVAREFAVGRDWDRGVLLMIGLCDSGRESVLDRWGCCGVGGV